MPSVAEVVAAIERRYDPSWAQEWDSVGLVCGDPAAQVIRAYVAVDPIEVIAEEAIAAHAQLLITHHPLFLGGTESVAATTPKGRVVQRLVTSGVALYVAHTNADVANPGVSDALAAAIGLRDVRPLEPGADRGLGRVGALPAPMSLADFTDLVGATLPATSWGARAAGDLSRLVSTVVVVGGSGGDMAAAAAAVGADVLLTADCKHHRTSEAVEETGVAIIDAAHWATEQPWTVAAAELLHADLAAAGITVEFTVSTTVTDPWTLHAASPTPEDL